VASLAMAVQPASAALVKALAGAWADWEDLAALEEVAPAEQAVMAARQSAWRWSPMLLLPVPALSTMPAIRAFQAEAVKALHRGPASVREQLAALEIRALSPTRTRIDYLIWNICAPFN
jgi:hypothetical protein